MLRKRNESRLTSERQEEYTEICLFTENRHTETIIIIINYNITGNPLSCLSRTFQVRGVYIQRHDDIREYLEWLSGITVSGTCSYKCDVSMISRISNSHSTNYRLILGVRTPSKRQSPVQSARSKKSRSEQLMDTAHLNYYSSRDNSPFSQNAQKSHRSLPNSPIQPLERFKETTLS